LATTQACQPLPRTKIQEIVDAPIEVFASPRGCVARLVTDFLSFRNGQEKQGGIAIGVPPG
jgi:hypothetical protein